MSFDDVNPGSFVIDEVPLHLDVSALDVHIPHICCPGYEQPDDLLLGTQIPRGVAHQMACELSADNLEYQRMLAGMLGFEQHPGYAPAALYAIADASLASGSSEEWRPATKLFDDLHQRTGVQRDTFEIAIELLEAADLLHLDGSGPARCYRVTSHAHCRLRGVAWRLCGDAVERVDRTARSNIVVTRKTMRSASRFINQERIIDYLKRPEIRAMHQTSAKHLHDELLAREQLTSLRFKAPEARGSQYPRRARKTINRARISTLLDVLAVRAGDTDCFNKKGYEEAANLHVKVENRQFTADINALKKSKLIYSTTEGRHSRYALTDAGLLLLAREWVLRLALDIELYQEQLHSYLSPPAKRMAG